MRTTALLATLLGALDGHAEAYGTPDDRDSSAAEDALFVLRAWGAALVVPRPQVETLLRTGAAPGVRELRLDRPLQAEDVRRVRAIIQVRDRHGDLARSLTALLDEGEIRDWLGLAPLEQLALTEQPQVTDPPLLPPQVYAGPRGQAQVRWTARGWTVSRTRPGGHERTVARGQGEAPLDAALRGACGEGYAPERAP